MSVFVILEWNSFFKQNEKKKERINEWMNETERWPEIKNREKEDQKEKKKKIEETKRKESASENIH